MKQMTTFSKPAFLALSLCVTIQANACDVSKYSIYSAASSVISSLTDKKVLATVAIVMWVHLQTKPKVEYSIDWQNDVDLLMSSYNPLDVESYKNIAYLFDKYVIGSPDKSSDEVRTNTLEDGTIVEVSGKKKTSIAFGAMGLFDKYVINMLEKLGNIGANWEKTNKLNVLLQGKSSKSEPTTK